MKNFAFVLVVLFAFAPLCASSTSHARSKKAASKKAALKKGRPVHVSKQRYVKRPSWWRENDRLQDWTVREVFVGSGVAVADVSVGNNKHLWFWTNAKGDVRGPLRVPDDATWLGFGKQGVIFVGTRSGKLLRSPTLADLENKAPTVVDEFEDVDAWDAGGNTIAVLSRSEQAVFISTDAGENFTSILFDDHPRALAVRSDGTLVVAGRALHVSNDGGSTWTATQISLRGLKRRGQFIGAGTGYGCEQASLARDGKTWIPFTEAPNFSHWNAAFNASAEARGFKRPTTRTDLHTPLAPLTSGKLALDVVEACRGQGSGGGGGTMGGMGRWGANDRADPCAVTSCMQAPAIKPAARFLLNGVCGAKAKPTRHHLRALSSRRRRRPIRENEKFEIHSPCTKTAMRSAGTIVLEDKTGIHLVPPPQQCRATRVLSKHGLTAVLCDASGQTTVHVWTSKGFTQEFQFEGGFRFADFAVDGTLLIEVQDREQRRAWVRRPLALGAANAWYEVGVSRGVAHRAVAGGRALVLADSKQKRLGSLQVTSSLMVPAKEERLQWAPGLLKETLANIQSCIAPLMANSPQLLGKVEVSLHIMVNGKVQPTISDIPNDDEAWKRCIADAYTATRMFLIDSAPKLVAGDVAFTIQFRAKNHSLDVTVADHESQSLVAEGVHVANAVRDMRAKEDGRIQIDVGAFAGPKWTAIHQE